jgi:hypothetical protein
LRAVFDAHFDDPRRTHEYRFVWDYWHVPNQYTLLRTPAADYFPKQDFAALERRLRLYAKDELGCAGVTPVWLSCYVEGMRQELHADVPHGPWAFVLSLTHWDERTWTGGETLILKPQTLDYWSNFDADAVVERESLVSLNPPKFNRLLVFDPRLPHGVPVVEGVRDPKQGRLVLHGWFNEPEPSLRGALADAARRDDDDDDDDDGDGSNETRRWTQKTREKFRRRGFGSGDVSRFGRRGFTRPVRDARVASARARHGGHRGDDRFKRDLLRDGVDRGRARRGAKSRGRFGIRRAGDARRDFG